MCESQISDFWRKILILVVPKKPVLFVSPWLGGFGPGVVLIRLNALNVPEKNEYKNLSEIPTGTPYKSPADASTCSRVELSCDILLTNVKL